MFLQRVIGSNFHFTTLLCSSSLLNVSSSQQLCLLLCSWVFCLFLRQVESCHTDQAALQMLGLKSCATTPSFVLHIIHINVYVRKYVCLYLRTHILYKALLHRLGRVRLTKLLRFCLPSARQVPQSSVPEVWTSGISLILPALWNPSNLAYYWLLSNLGTLLYCSSYGS